LCKRLFFGSYVTRKIENRVCVGKEKRHEKGGAGKEREMNVDPYKKTSISYL